MRKIFFTVVALLGCFSAWGDDIYTAPLAEIARTNRTLGLSHSQTDAELAANHTGLTPENPEVEFGYLWGNALTGNRKDVSVTQSFDFPTVYYQRRALAKERDESAQRRQLVQRHDILLEAKEVLVQLVCQNALVRLCEAQKSDAVKMVEISRQMYESGNVTALDHSKAELNCTRVSAALSRAELERDRLRGELVRLNGGDSIRFDAVEYPDTPIPTDFDSWFAEAEQKYPTLVYLKSEVATSRRGRSLARAEGLPKIMVGYMGEYVHESNFSGVKVGVSIPLWENRGRVNEAKKRTVAANDAVADAQAGYRESMRSLLNQATILARIESECRAGFAASATDELLRLAYDKGQLTLHEYISEMQYRFELQTELLETRRDRELALARLWSFTL